MLVALVVPVLGQRSTEYIGYCGCCGNRLACGRGWNGLILYTLVSLSGLEVPVVLRSLVR